MNQLVPKTSAERTAPPASPVELLTENVVYDGWHETVGATRSFYVRGATWFRTKVLHPDRLNVILGYDKARFKNDVLFEGRGEWESGPFPWTEPFSPRQPFDALSANNRKPVRFDKAVKTILLCRHVAASKAGAQTEFGAEEPMLRMHVEPAVFYICGFDNELADELVKERPSLLGDLMTATGQRSRFVFRDMAAGKTVTKSLAQKTREALGGMFSREFGVIDFQYHPDHALGAATTETLHGA